MRLVDIGSVIAFASIGVLGWGAGCSSSNNGNGSADGGTNGGSNSGGGLISFDAASRCVNGQCPQECPGGGSTTITGKVLDPAGINPLPFIAVYIPNSPNLGKLPRTGASCTSCESLYTNTVLAGTLTDATGSFTLQGPNVPTGPSIPIVVQAGKWRKEYTMSVQPCQANPAPTGLRLPRNSSEGDLPDIAISTGGADSLECLLTRIGVSDSEFVDGASMNGHIHIFEGGTMSGEAGPTIDTNTPASFQSLWDSEADLQKFDIVLLSCEGAETGNTNPAALDNYVMAGGRVFASHFHYKWFNDTQGPFPSYNLAQWMPGANTIMTTVNAIVQTKLPSGSPFPKGQTMQTWLQTVGALDSNMELPIQGSRFNAIVGPTNNKASTPWIDADQNVPSPGVPGMTQYFSWDEPLNSGENVCGRVVYSDLHVGSASGDYGTGPSSVSTTGGITPSGCNHMAKLSPQEDALEFMLFDLSACLTPPNLTPANPPVAK